MLCKFWQLYSGVNGNLLRGDLCHTHIPRAPVPAADHCRPIPPQEMPKHSSVSVSVGSLGPGVHKICLSPLLWQVRGLFLNVIWPLIPSSWGFSFALGCGVSLFGGIQHPPVDGCSAVSCSFGVLTGEDECTSFCSAIFQVRQQPLLLQGSGTSAQ